MPIKRSKTYRAEGIAIYIATLDRVQKYFAHKHKISVKSNCTNFKPLFLLTIS